MMEALVERYGRVGKKPHDGRFSYAAHAAAFASPARIAADAARADERMLIIEEARIRRPPHLIGARLIDECLRR